MWRRGLLFFSVTEKTLSVVSDELCPSYFMKVKERKLEQTPTAAVDPS